MSSTLLSIRFLTTNLDSRFNSHFRLPSVLESFLAGQAIASPTHDKTLEAATFAATPG